MGFVIGGIVAFVILARIVYIFEQKFIFSGSDRYRIGTVRKVFLAVEHTSIIVGVAFSVIGVANAGGNAYNFCCGTRNILQVCK